MNSREPTGARRDKAGAAAGGTERHHHCLYLGSVDPCHLPHSARARLPFQLRLFEDKGTPFLGQIFTFEGWLVLGLVIIGVACVLIAARHRPGLPDFSGARPCM